jgi:hypothetical protein
LYGLNFTLHELLKNEQVAAIAKKYNVSVPQLGIRYSLQPDMLPLPKTEVLTTNFFKITVSHHLTATVRFRYTFCLTNS